MAPLLSNFLSLANNLTPFSGFSVDFSVGFCINEGYVTNLSSENNLPMFQLNVPVVIRAEVKKCKQTSKV